MITHPSGSDKHTWSDPSYALKHAEELKYKRYLDNLNIDENDVVPLIFDSFGGYASKTFQKLNEWVQAIVQDDPTLHGPVMRGLRDAIAVAIHKAAFFSTSKINIIHCRCQPPAGPTLSGSASHG